MSESWQCPYCESKSCYGECENYLIQMMKRGIDRDKLEQIFKEIPKFNYVLNSKIASIFGTEIEVAKDSETSEERTFEFKQFLFRKNGNGKTNFSELKKVLREKEIYGKAYLFFDPGEEESPPSLYCLGCDDVKVFIPKKPDAIINEVSYYTVGEPDVPDAIDWSEHPKGFIRDDNGYIISKENMLIFDSDSYVLNSDLMQLQNLIQINRKVNESTTYRDYGNIFVFPKGNISAALSATGHRIRDEVNKVVEKMRNKVASLIKKNNTKDSNVIMLDEQYEKIEQVKPLTVIKDYEFYWKKQDEIISSVVNFPTILLNLGEASGNISKEALIKDARANFLYPLKNDTANVLSMLCDKLFGEEGYYIRFADFEDTKL